MQASSGIGLWKGVFLLPSMLLLSRSLIPSYLDQFFFVLTAQPYSVLYIHRYRNQTLFPLPLRSKYRIHASAAFPVFAEVFPTSSNNSWKDLCQYIDTYELEDWAVIRVGCSGRRSLSMLSVFPKERTAFTQRVSIASQN